MADSAKPETSLFALHRIPNGLVILLAVALLLQGPAGAFEALKNYTADLIGAMFGGQELLWEVVCQTAPLVVVCGAIAFLYRGGLLAPNSLTSWMAAAVVVIAASWLGTEVRSVVAKKRPTAQSQIAMMPASSVEESTQIKLLSPSSQAEFAIGAGEQIRMADGTTSGPETISIATALGMLSDFRAPATDGTHHDWAARIPRVAVLPESGSALAKLGWAVNQLLGYFVVYRPRLFFAAVLLGCYLGWCWQPYWQALSSVLARSPNPKTVPSP